MCYFSNTKTWHLLFTIRSIDRSYNDNINSLAFLLCSQQTWPTANLCLRLLSMKNISEVMMTSSNGKIFRVTGPLCGKFTGPGEFPTQRPVTRSSDVYFDLRPNKRLSKQSLGWWFETLSCSLWRHRNVLCRNPVSRSVKCDYIPQYLRYVTICPCPRYLLLVHTPDIITWVIDM